jgi:hypothetical protein
VPTRSTSPVLRSLTIAELLLAYWKFVESYYIKDGPPTSEPDTIRQAFRFVRQLYNSTAAHEFTPKKLKAVRQAMIEHPIVRNSRCAIQPAAKSCGTKKCCTVD